MGHQLPKRHSKMVGTTGRIGFAQAVALSALLCGTMVGCASDPPELCYNVNIFTPANQDPFTGVSLLRLFAESGGKQVGEEQVVSYAPGGAGSIPTIPFGDDVSLVIEGWTGDGAGGLGSLLARGKTPPLACAAGQAATGVPVLMVKVNSFADLTHTGSLGSVSLSQGRIAHTATSTPLNEIVVVGGRTISDTNEEWWKPGDSTTYSTSIEVIMGGDNSVRTHASMFFPRAWHTSTALNTGQVLIAGGYTNIEGTAAPIKHVEVYEPGPQGQVQTLQQLMAVPRAGHTATLIDDASYTILYVGGDSSATGTFEVWNPIAGSTGAKELPGGRKLRHHTAALFQVPGRAAPSVLIAGGEDDDGNLSDAVFIYDAGSDRMIELSDTLGEARTQLGAVFVPARNYVYILGGYKTADRSQASTLIDVYDITNETLGAPSGFRLKKARGGHASVSLGGNMVLMVGGTDGIKPLDEIEVVYEFVDTNNSVVIDTAVSNSDANAGPLIPFLPEARLGARAVLTRSGVGLVIGGASDGTTLMPTGLHFYNPF